MSKQLYQWNFEIKGLIPEEVKLKRKVWLRKGELLLEKKADKLYAYLLGDDSHKFSMGEEIEPYLRFSSLISNNAPDVKGGSGIPIKSKEDLGKAKPLSTSIKVIFPSEAIPEVEKYAHKFIAFIGKLHDKYIGIVNENEFLEIAMDYFHDSEKKFVYSDEGFISATISLESLYNESPSDIKYKLSHRAAFLLSLCGIDPIEVFEKLKELYNTRSKLVHGGGATTHDPERNLVTRFTRWSIILFLILLSNEKRRAIGKGKRKKEVLKEIDHAMLNAEIRNELKKEIKKGIKNFNLNIPRTFEGERKQGSYRVTAW